jgi:hydrogenase expression/formation protein HypE
MSKFSLGVLNKCVYPYLNYNAPDVILGAVFGEDVALTRINDGILVSHLDPIVGAVKNIGWLAVHVACNDIATSGAPPRWILLLVLVPKKEDEQLLVEIMCDVERAARETGVTIIGGHTGYSSNLSRPLVAVTALGTISGRTPVCTKGAQIGDHIFVTKGIALEGTAILAYDFAHVAWRLGLSEGELMEARQLMTRVSISSGTLVATIPPEHVESASQSLLEKGIPFADIGQVIEDNGVKILKDGEFTHYQEIRCEADELARMWELYLGNDA